MINITLKGGDVRQVEAGTTLDALCRDISMGLYRAACAARVDGEVADLRLPLEADCTVEILTFDDIDGKKAYWHTASHVMAQAVKRKFPSAKLAIGPATDSGFYYDFDAERPFTPEDLAVIEAEMKAIIKEALPIERFTLARAEALELVKEEPYKVELIGDLPEDAVLSFYKQGEFTDLCAGPHLPDTGRLKAYKLLSVNSAYWRGDSDRAVLQRIYGIAFPKAAELEAHLTMLEEAKKRDHRRLGKDLELFTFMDEGPGFPFFLPKGMILKNNLLDFWRGLHAAAGYQEINTPIMLDLSLWRRSGHWDHYKNNMYTTEIDEQGFAVKPMNCPGCMLVYKTKMRSYRDLPLRLCELGLVHRHELSGALHGLFRVRCFTQDDAHIFMTMDQVKDEIKGVVNLLDTIYRTFGFEYRIELSTQPEDSMGSKEDWDLATESLRQAITEMGYEYKLNEGDGAFYGPKLDFHLTDCLGRSWQCGTIQLDFQMPERFELEYTGADDQGHRPIMIHRAIYGSIERFIGILTEHFAGAFPLWLAPEQVRVLPISEKQTDAVNAAVEKLRAAGLRAEGDLRPEKVGYKIRAAQLEKIPYMLVIGDREAESGEVSVRSRRDGDQGVLPLESFVANALREIADKTL